MFITLNKSFLERKLDWKLQFISTSEKRRGEICAALKQNNGTVKSFSHRFSPRWIHIFSKLSSSIKCQFGALRFFYLCSTSFIQLTFWYCAWCFYWFLSDPASLSLPSQWLIGWILYSLVMKKGKHVISSGEIDCSAAWRKLLFLRNSFIEIFRNFSRGKFLFFGCFVTFWFYFQFIPEHGS